MIGLLLLIWHNQLNNKTHLQMLISAGGVYKLDTQTHTCVQL